MTDTWCATCLERFATRRNAEEMTGDERADEMAAWGGPLEIALPLVHQRIEELVGRPVQVVKMGSDGFPALIEEARRRRRPSK